MQNVNTFCKLVTLWSRKGNLLIENLPTDSCEYWYLISAQRL